MNAAEFVLSGGMDAAGSGAPALVAANESLTYGELTQRVARFAAGFREAGLRRGDRVALLTLDTPDLAASILAVIAAGGVAVPLSPRASREDVQHVLAIARPFALVADDAFAAEALAALDASPRTVLLRAEHDVARWKAHADSSFAPVDAAPGDAAFWVVTSGTTGRPKGVEHRHDNVLACTAFLAHALGATHADRFFATSRLHFAYALGTVLFGALRTGATTVLLDSWPTPETVAATIERFAPTIVCSVPAMYRKLLELVPARGDGEPFRAVRHYVSAGERLPPALASAWEKTTGRAILDGMGCSESIYMLFANTPHARRAGSSGRPVPGVDVRLTARGGTRSARTGEPGALHVRTPSLCSGYRLEPFEDGAPPQRLPERFDEGWCATGDEYLVDEDGFYHHCGRSDDMLRVAGIWVAPAEIEDALVGGEHVADGAAIAVAGDADLAEIVLYVVPAAGADPDDALAEARARVAAALPPFKRPRRFVAVTDLPRTGTGKVQRYKLREALAVQR